MEACPRELRRQGRGQQQGKASKQAEGLPHGEKVCLLPELAPPGKTPAPPLEEAVLSTQFFPWFKQAGILNVGKSPKRDPGDRIGTRQKGPT
jgi:hypothetical protein